MAFIGVPVGGGVGATVPAGANQQPRFCPELRYHTSMFHFLNTVTTARLANVGEDEDIDQTRPSRTG
jgi:hypothetical protein